MKRRLLAAMLALAMVITMVPMNNVAALAETSDSESTLNGDVSGDPQETTGLSWADEAKELGIGDTDLIDSLNAEEEAHYKITVSEDGSYEFGTTGNSDTYGVLYNSEGEEIASNDDGSSSSNFKIQQELSADKVYYLAVYGYNHNSVSDVTVYAATASEETEETESTEESGSGDVSGDPGSGDVSGDPEEETGITWTDEAKELSINTTDVSSLASGEEAHYKITVSQTGNYIFGTTGNSDTYGVLYNSAGREMQENDDSGSGSNFLIQAELTAGNTYYLAAYGYNHDAVSVLTVYAEKGLDIQCSDDGKVKADFQEDTTLSVTVPEDQITGDITYQWYYGDSEDEIEGATDASYTIKAGTYSGDEDGICYYYCIVNVGSKSATAQFTVTVEGMPVVKINHGYVRVNYEEALTLNITANDPYNTGVNYQWYYQQGYDGKKTAIEGATDASYTIAAKSYPAPIMYYYCQVTMGEYSVLKECEVSVSSLTVTVPEQTAVTLGNETTLKIEAVSSYSDQLTYSWYERNPDGSYVDEAVVPTTTTGEYTYTVTTENTKGFGVYVEDGFSSVSYYVYPNVTNLSPYTADFWLNQTEEDGKIIINANTSWYKNDDYDEEETDDVNMTCTYAWYKYQWNPETGFKEYMLIEGENGASLSIDASDPYAEYKCVVNAVDPEGLSCAAASDTIWAGDEDNDNDFFDDWYSSFNGDKTWGDTLTIKIMYGDDEIDEGSDVTYQWYGSTGTRENNNGDIIVTGWKKIEGATTAAFSTVADENTPYEYRCIVCYKGLYYDAFTVESRVSPIVVNDSSDYWTYVRYGKGTTLYVDAESMKEGATLSYKWSYANDSTGYDYREIDGASDAVYKVPADLLKGDEDTGFECTISDGTYEKTVYMYVKVYRTKVSIDYECANYGEDYSATAKIIGDTTNIQYKWYWDGTLLSGNNTATCTIPAEKLAAPGSGKSLECVVTVGNEGDTFTSSDDCRVYTKNTLTVEEDSDVDVNYGEAASLSVDASTTTDNTITYQWYKYVADEGYVMLDGETGKTLNVTAQDTVVPELTYYCAVSDQVMTATQYFYLSVNVVKDNDCFCFNGSGDSLILSASALDTVKNISRQWAYYDEEKDSYENIEGATGESYTITDNKSGEYQCKITVGDQTWTESYTVKVAGTLAVLTSDRIIEGQSEIKMSVTAATSTDETITYQWQSADADGKYADIEGADTAALTVAAKDLALYDGCLAYRCKVSDGTSSETVIFNSEYSPFTWEVEGSDNKNSSYYDFRDNNIGDTVKVNAQSVVDSDITYQWAYYDTSEWEWVTIDSATGSSLKLQKNWVNDYDYIELKCLIMQGTCSERIDIYVDYPTTIQIEDYEDYVYAQKGDEVSLKINASSEEGKDLTYTWYYNNEFGYKEQIEGATSNSLTVDTSAAEFTTSKGYTYYVEISDGTEAETCSFWLYLNEKTQEDDLKFTTDGWTFYRVLSGQPVTFTAELKEAPEGEVTYQWYQYTETDDYDSEYVAIDGATSNSYTVQTEGYEDTIISLYCVATCGTHKGTYYGSVNVEKAKGNLTENEVMTITDDSERIVSFTPSESGTYTFETLNGLEQNDTGNYTYKRIILYHLSDGRLKKVSQASSGATDESYLFSNIKVNPEPNLDLQCELIEGETYYFKVQGSDLVDNSELQVMIHQGDYTLYTDYVEADPGEEVTLEASKALVSAGDSFQWYMITNLSDEVSNFYKMNNAVGQTLTVTAPEAGSDLAYYTCVITKTDGSTVRLNYKVKYTTIITPDGTKTGKAYASFTAKAGQTIVLDATSESTRGKELTYTWKLTERDCVSISTDGGVCTVKIADDFNESEYDGLLNQILVTCVVDDGYSTRKIVYNMYDPYNMGYGGDYDTDYWEEMDTPTPKWSATLPGDTWTYDGTEKTPDPVVTSEDGTTTLTKDTDYSVTYYNNLNAGTASVVLTGLGDYKGRTETLNFRIAAADVANAVASVAYTAYTYTGSEIRPAVTVKLGGRVLTSGTDYTVEYSSNTNVGTAYYYITCKGNYTGTKTGTFTINAASLSAASVTVKNTSVAYTGSAFTPKVTVVLGDKTLTYETDYTVEYSNNTEAGTAAITVTGQGNYKDTTTGSFTITPASIETASVNAAVTENPGYTGEAIKPAVSVILNSKKLSSDTDYTVEYSNNTNAGTAKIIVTGKGNYTGTASGIFTIDPVNLNMSAVTIKTANTSVVYTGSEITPAVTVQVGDNTLTADTDYTLTYENNTEIGTATIWIAGKGNYTGKLKKTFEIVAAKIDIAGATVAAAENSYTYSGSAIKPEVVVTLANGTGLGSDDFDVTFGNNTAVGTATITVTAKGSYTGTASGTFTIAPASVEDAVVTASVSDNAVYTGKAFTPVVKVVLNGKELTSGTDYTVAYSDNTNAGTALVTVTGKGNYTGTATGTFTIAPANLAEAHATVANASAAYTGSEITPAVTVTYGDLTLAAGTDYTVAYADNTEVGTATVTVTGKGNFTGTLQTTFQIAYPLATPSISKVANTTTGMKITWAAVEGAAKYRVLYKSGSTWVKLADTASTSYSFKKLGTKSLTAGADYCFTVRCIDSTGNIYTSDVDNTGKSYRYMTATKPTLTNLSTGIKISWKKITGATGYIIYRKAGSGSYAKVKKIAKNATVAYTDTAVKSKNGTKYTYLVKAYYGSSYSAYTAVATYRLTAPAISSLKNVSGKKMTVKWGKNTKASGYEVQYSLKSTFASGNKTVKITKNSTVTKTISSLTKGKTYYVRVRAYKTSGSTKYYSAWGTKKSVKIAK